MIPLCVDLTGTNKHIKDNLYKFLEGDFNVSFGPEQIKTIIETSFLLNNLYLDRGKIIFKYNNTSISINYYLHDIPSEFLEESIISSFRHESEFKSCLKQFLRDYKIGKVLL